MITAKETPEIAPDRLSAPAAGGGYNVALGYLRTVLVILVVAHHAVLAYHPLAPAPPPSLTASPWWRVFPIVDSARWSGFAWFNGFNDLFFMALMFFLSGLFVAGSVRRKGAGAFFRNRLLRLGLPFLGAIALVSPLAYFPTWLQIGGSGVTGFWRQWMALEHWPSGPAWFLWVLLVFDGIAALWFAFRRPAAGGAGWISAAFRRPAAAFLLLVSLSAAAYIPMALKFHPLQWTEFGPFAVQTGRAFHYLVYFLLGVAVGVGGINRSVLTPGSKLARRWPLWVLGALLAFGCAAAAALVPHVPSRGWTLVGALTFVVSCAASSFACLAVFGRFARSRVRWLDSLSGHSYGIYVVHYAFVTWLQYVLLRAHFPAAAKGLLVTAGAVALSWAAVALLRSARAVRRVI